MGTPDGRIRPTSLATAAAIKEQARKTARYTNRWRSRRNASRAIIVAQATTRTVPDDPTSLMPRAITVIHGVRMALIHRRMELSALVTAASTGCTQRPTVSAPAAPTSRVHRRVGMLIERGRGGGSPDGRRRRPR